MKLKTLLGAVSLVAVSQVSATVLTLDTFTVAQTVVGNAPSVITNTSTSPAAGDAWTSREMSITAPASTFGGLPALQIGNQQLALSSFSEAGVASVSWTLNEALAANFAGYADWKITIQEDALPNPGGGVTVTSGQMRSYSSTGATSAGIVLAQMADPFTNPFVLNFQWLAASDARFSNLKLEYSCQQGTSDLQNGVCQTNDVPVPASAALLGLGLLGMFRFNRKSKI